jgi:hypothetical protein
MSLCENEKNQNGDGRKKTSYPCMKTRKLRLGPFSLSFQTLFRSYQFLKNSMVTPWRISVTTGRLWVKPEKARRLRKGPFSLSFQALSRSPIF